MDNPKNLTPMDGMAIGDLVNLTLGESDEFEVLRVHGGWIYTRIHRPASLVFGGGKQEPSIMAPVFVPEPPTPIPMVLAQNPKYQN